MALRVVVVGLGPRGQDWLREIQNAPGFEFAAGVDVDASSSQASSRQRCLTLTMLHQI